MLLLGKQRHRLHAGLRLDVEAPLTGLADGAGRDPVHAFDVEALAHRLLRPRIVRSPVSFMTCTTGPKSKNKTALTDAGSTLIRR